MRGLDVSSSASLCGFLVLALVVPGCDDDDGGGGAPLPAAPLLRSGLFTVCELQLEKVGPGWDPTSVMFACDIDGAGTVAIDRNLDGDYSDDTAAYECRPDGTIWIEGGVEGVYSEDGELLAVTEASSTDSMDIAVAVREGRGMTVDDFDGPYLATKFAINGVTGVAHTYTVLATPTGHGLGGFRVLESSDPAVVGVLSPFTFDVEDDGAFTLVDSHEQGALKSDGSMFVAAEVDDANDIESIMFGIRTSSGLNSAILQGEYMANLVGKNTFTNEPWTARLLATFDGVGIARYEFLAHPAGGGGLSGYLVYSVAGSGLLVVQVGPPGPIEIGIVSGDGNVFTVIDADPTDGQIYALIGIKRPA